MKILVSDVIGEQAHADACKGKIETECPTATVTTRLESLSASVTYAISNGIDIISRSTTGLSDSRNESEGDTAWAGIDEDSIYGSAVYGTNKYTKRAGIVHALGSNSHILDTDPSGLDVISACSAGDGSGNCSASYGAGLEYFSDEETTQSYSTARIAGIIGQLLIDNPSWNFHDARQALRQTASFYDTGWIADGGYGAIDKTAAKAVTSLAQSSPTRVAYSDSTFTWVNSWLTDFDSTVIALSCTEPDRDTDINDLYILYDGSLEECSTTSLKLNGNYWIVYLSKNSDSDYSEIESFDKDEITFTYTAENVSCSIQAQTINCTLEIG